MKIENVSIEDTEEILAIYAPYVKDTAISFEYEVPSVEEFEQRIRTISEKYPYIKAVDDETGEILGYAYASAFKSRKAYDWSVETTIYVNQKKRRNGIGRSLYTELENQLTAMGILNANACIAVPAEQDENLDCASWKFHEKMGYQLVGMFHNCGFKFQKWYNMIWMEKMLGVHTSAPREVKK